MLAYWVIWELVCSRVFGTSFAEIPFVATRDGYRRDGNLTRLMEASAAHLPHSLNSSSKRHLAGLEGVSQGQYIVHPNCIAADSTDHSPCIHV